MRAIVLFVVVNCLTFGTACAQTTESWETQRTKRQADLKNYLREKEIAYKWFANFPFGTEDGIPYLILRSLPLLAPEVWGEGDDFLSVVGLFRDERQPDYPIARGMGWSGLGRKSTDHRVDFVSFACGACHVGRLRHDDGSIQYLDGGINTEFNVVAYRVKVKQTIESVIGQAKKGTNPIDALKSALLKVIDKAHQEDPNYFYNDYAFGQKFDAAYERRQIELFKANAGTLLPKFLGRMKLEVTSLQELINKNYKGYEQPMLHGFGGMADATGVSTSFGFVVARDVNQDETATPETRLPPAPGLTDFMAVWEQGKRLVSWNADKTKLINGGGQWNGNIPLPIYRNLAAEMTMGFGPNTDVRIAEFSRDLLTDLSAPPYPFDVDLQLAEKGKVLFKANCADCHRPHNDRVYPNIGTDLSRAMVVSPQIAAGARIMFKRIGPPDRSVSLPPDGVETKPFGSFKGVSLADKPDIAMRDPAECLGYNALPLGGIWAQAPYLHSGSVPTLYHLLMPNERPDVFVKSRLEYDQKMVGFQWKPKRNETESSGYSFDTRAFPTVSKRGHDRDIYENGKLYRLDWTTNRDDAMAIIEYMKTL